MEGGTWHFPESHRRGQKYKLRALAQGKTKRHKFKCNLESDFINWSFANLNFKALTWSHLELS